MQIAIHIISRKTWDVLHLTSQWHLMHYVRGDCQAGFVSTWNRETWTATKYWHYHTFMGVSSTSKVKRRSNPSKRVWIYFDEDFYVWYTGDLHIRWSTGCPPVDHRMSHPHASGNVPEVVHWMCRIRWTTGCAASGGPLDVCMRWTTRCVHAVQWSVRGGNPMDNQMWALSGWRLECYVA